jgi:hypothetical protein
VSIIINKINNWLHKICKYYGLTKNTRYQLKFLDYYIYKRFRKILCRKFGSKPGVQSFVKQKFIKWKKNKYRYASKNKILALTTDIKPNLNSSLTNFDAKPSNFFYDIYLNSKKNI